MSIKGIKLVKRNNSWKYFICSLFATSLFHLQAKEQGQRIPDEFESLGGHSLGFGNGGTAASSGLGSIRSNPAMLAIEPQYSISAGYHWPTVGRDFYQAGAVDSKTSNIAAGLSYTSSYSEFGTNNAAAKDDHNFSYKYDSPVKYRIAGGLAQPFSQLAFGIGGQYVDGFQINSKNANNTTEELTRVNGATLALGVAGLITKQVRFGLSAENLANDKVSDLAPRTYRGGLAYTTFSGNLTLHADFIQRDRVPQEKFNIVESLEEPLTLNKETPISKPEQMLVGSASVRIQNILRILVAMSEDVSKSSRRSLSGGVAVVNNSFSVSYLLGKPYLNDRRTHQAVNISFQVAL